MIDIAKKSKVKLVFLSQPVLWQKDLSPEDDALLFGIITDGNIHFSRTALANGMEMFNRRLEKVCKKSNTPFIRSQLESSSVNFFDDCHFTEKGAKTLANQVFEGLDSLNLINQ